MKLQWVIELLQIDNQLEFKGEKKSIFKNVRSQKNRNFHFLIQRKRNFIQTNSLNILEFN